MNKKYNMILLLIIAFLVVSCGKSQRNIDIENKQRKLSSDKKEENQVMINLDEYQYVVPENEKGKESHVIMEESLRMNKTIEMDDLALTFMLYGLEYDIKDKQLITCLFVFNNSDKTVENFSFQYDENLSSIGGKNEGRYKFVYRTKPETINIPSKSIRPIFIESFVTLKNPKDFYTAEEVGSFDFQNVMIYYADPEEDNKE